MKAEELVAAVDMRREMGPVEKVENPQLKESPYVCLRLSHSVL